jgi:hypothetical protein
MRQKRRKEPTPAAVGVVQLPLLQEDLEHERSGAYLRVDLEAL